MPRGQYDRSPEATEARRQAREMSGERKPAKRAGVNIDRHPDAKFGEAGIRVEVLPAPVPTLYMKVELPDVNDDNEYLEDLMNWFRTMREKACEYGDVKEMVVTGMPSTMKVII